MEPFAESEDLSGTSSTDTEVKVVKQDDPNKDYSLGIGLTVVADVVVIAILAGLSYLICSEKKKTN